MFKLVNTNNPLCRGLNINKKKSKQSFRFKTMNPQIQLPFEIFAYCSKNYKDAYDFVIDSWCLPNVNKITIYTDFDLEPTNKKVHVINMFEENKDWLVGTGRRLDVIKHYLKENEGKNKNVLFLDIDCFIVKDPSHVFNQNFDIALTRLFSNNSYTNSTATAGLWFAKLTPKFYTFISDWCALAQAYKQKGKGITKYKISYVQYSFTTIARNALNNLKYHVLPINENLYNSEHSVNSKWLANIDKSKPYILHFKGRKFRDPKLVNTVLRKAGAL